MKDGAKILVAYDGSEFSKRALAEAVDLARRAKGSVTLLHVFWSPERTRIEGTELRDQPTIRILKDAEDDLKKAKVKYEALSERSDDPPHVILKTAEEGGFDCIAMGSRGAGGAKAWLLGSVSSRVIAEASCPVLVVK